MPPGKIDQRVIVGIFALVCMFAAGLLGYQWLSGERAKLAREHKELMKLYQNPVNVVIAAKDIPEDTALELSHLEVASIPEKYVQPYAIPAAQQEKAPGWVTIAAIAKGEQILKNKLRRADQAPSGSTLSSMTPKGKRAVTIAVDIITGVGGFVRPGDVVDILWSIKLPDAAQKEGQVVTMTLFQDVPVLAIGTDLPGRAARPPAEKGQEAPKDQQYLVTLALPPQETAFLLFAREQGRIQLSLRPAKETGDRVELTPANINTLMQALLGKSGQTEAPKPPRSVTIFRAGKQETVQLPSSE